MAEKIKRLENSLKSKNEMSDNVHYVNLYCDQADGLPFVSQNGTGAISLLNKNNFQK